MKHTDMKYPRVKHNNIKSFVRTALCGAALLFSVTGLAWATIPAPDDVATVPEDADLTASGLASKVLQIGDGTASPSPADTVVVHYTGWSTDGKMFDSSVTRGKKAELPLDRVIDGWTEGLQLMVVGEKRRFWIPEELAYQGRAGRPAGMLVFDVELFEIRRASTPAPATNTPAPATNTEKGIPAPPDVAAPPADAEVTKTGLASKVLKPGVGKRRPNVRNTVQVHYTGWTTDGEMFDSSVLRGQPASFGLRQVIRGWTEGLQLMVVGEKRRFWIPEKLAYKGQRGRPAGMLVFDVELIGIE